MSSLKADFDELVTRIRHGRELGHASFEPIYYLVFPPAQILEVKRRLPAWMAQLRNDGWEVHPFSIAERDRRHPGARRRCGRSGWPPTARRRWTGRRPTSPWRMRSPTARCRTGWRRCWRA